MVEVFKTDVKCPFVAQQIIADLLATFIYMEVNFDLEDCDCILRLAFEKSFPDLVEKVQEIIQNNGAKATLLSNNIEDETNIFLTAPADGECSIKAFLSFF